MDELDENPHDHDNDSQHTRRLREDHVRVREPVPIGLTHSGNNHPPASIVSLLVAVVVAVIYYYVLHTLSSVAKEAMMSLLLTVHAMSIVATLIGMGALYLAGKSYPIETIFFAQAVTTLSLCSIQLWNTVKAKSAVVAISVGALSGFLVFVAAIYFVFRRYLKKNRTRAGKSPHPDVRPPTSSPVMWTDSSEGSFGGLSFLWQTEYYASVSAFSFRDSYTVSCIDRIKLGLESFSGEEWVWWPLKRPQPSCPAGYTRLYIHDSVSALDWIDVSRSLALTFERRLNHYSEWERSVSEDGTRMLKRLVIPEAEPDPPTVPASLTRQAVAGRTSSPSKSQSSSTVARPDSESASGTRVSKGQRARTPPPREEQASDPDPIGNESETPPNGHNCKKHYLLYGVYKGSRMRHGVIELPLQCSEKKTSSFCDHQFVSLLSRQVRHARGWHHYLSTRRLHHFSCSLFEKFGPDTLEYAKEELPPTSNKTYVMERRPEPYENEQPISGNQWYHRLYNGINHPDPLCATELTDHIPKRASPFQLAIHKYDGTGMREYGLYAVLAPCWSTVIAYQILIFALPLVFYAYHLVKSPGDQQNAIVPWTIVIGAEMLLWAPLSRFFEDRKRK